MVNRPPDASDGPHGHGFAATAKAASGTRFSRRALGLGAAHLAGWYAVFEAAQSSAAWARQIKPNVRRWAETLNEVSEAVRAGHIEPTEWQTSIERLHAAVPLEEIIRLVDLDALLTRVRPPKNKLGAVEDVDWSGLTAGRPTVGIAHKVFVYRKGACTPPHAHNHLVSAHLVLKGQIRARTFNRLEELEHSLLLEPTTDRLVGPGETVSMSDERDNVHWFEGVSALSASFDVPVGGITPEKPYRHRAEGFGQLFVDPRVPARADGRIEAPIITFTESVKRFGE